MEYARLREPSVSQSENTCPGDRAFLAQTDLYHNFGELIGQEAMQSGELAVQNGSYLQWNIQGFVNGTAGVFQYGGLLSPTAGVLYVTHTLFDEF